MKIGFHAFGCKVNQYEIEELKGKAEKRGHTAVGAKEFADAYIINTCSVTSLAEKKARNFIRRMKKLNEDSIVAVTGCYAQVSQDELMNLSQVDMLVGMSDKGNIIPMLEDFSQNRNEGAEGDERLVSVGSVDNFNEYLGGSNIVEVESRTRAYVKIEDGCDRFCSYCIIPYARGAVKWREEADVIREVVFLVENGYREIILTGINTALYPDLTGLLRAIDILKGDFRVRLSSMEPTVVDAKYVDNLLEFKRLCPSIHLSVQSGSNEVLKRMNRWYGIDEYKEIVNLLKNHNLYYGITTDIIVGFPGETEDEFRETLKLIDEVDFANVHSFPYSRRKGTVADGMMDQIDPEVKKERMKRIFQSAAMSKKRFFERNVGRVEKVLFEEESGGMIHGYTSNHIRAYLPAGGGHVFNEFYPVRIVRKYADGVLVEECKENGGTADEQIEKQR